MQSALFSLVIYNLLTSYLYFQFEWNEAAVTELHDMVQQQLANPSIPMAAGLRKKPKSKYPVGPLKIPEYIRLLLSVVTNKSYRRTHKMYSKLGGRTSQRQEMKKDHL